MPVLGLDVGGANLKAAVPGAAAFSVPFPLWKTPHALPEALRQLVDRCPSHVSVALTMTGELCDCFETKRHGVEFILEAIAKVTSRPLQIWQTDGRFVDLPEARCHPLASAASNWLALATFAGRIAPSGPAILLDIGSTTTDIIPLLDGRPIPMGRSDPERLRSCELVYTGVRRTPVCSLLGGHGAAELFATTLDVYLVLGQLPQEETDHDTADGRPATRPFAEARLARMILADRETSTAEQRFDVAVVAARQQVRLLTHALETIARRLPGPPETVILSGSGEFLGEIAWNQQTTCPPTRVVSLSREWGQEVSTAACAYAVAVLAAEART